MKRTWRPLLVVLCLVLVFSSVAIAAEKEEEKLFSLKNKDIDMRDALQMIARAAKVNVVFSRDVRGKIAVELTNVPHMKAMEAIALTNKLVVHEYDKKSKIYLILRHDDAEFVMRHKMMKRRQARRRQWEKRSKRRDWSRKRSGGGGGFWNPHAAGGGGGGRGNSWQDYAPDDEDEEEE